MPSKESPVSIDRLINAIQDDRRSLQPFRQNRFDLWARIAGTNWSDSAAPKDQPVNLASLTVQVLGRSLIPKNPRMMFSTFEREHKADIKTCESWVNDKIETIDLARTLLRARIDAFAGMGIIKVALANPADSARLTWRLTAGEPFAEIIDLDDWVWEMRSKEMSQCGYMGHRYRCPLDVIRDDSRNYTKQRKELMPTTRRSTNPEGDDRIEVLSAGFVSVDKEGFEDMVDLWEIYVARHKLIYTFSDDQLTGICAKGNDYGDLEPLRVQRWIGPDCGPYHILGDFWIAGNLMPKGYLVDGIPLHDAANDVMRKLIRQTQRFKAVLCSQGANDEDIERIRTENDGGTCRTTGAPPKEVRYGGPDPALMEASRIFQEQFSKHMGNLETMGGLSTQAGTLGQERLLSDNSSRAIADLQGNTMTFVASVVDALSWYWWGDPYKVMRVKVPVSQSSGLEVTAELPPEKRIQTKWEDIQKKIDPYSMQHQTPGAKLQFIVQTLTQLILPTLGLLQKQGIGLDANKLLNIISKLGDSPELAEILTVGEPPEQQAAPSSQAAEGNVPQPPQGGTYTRRNVSEATPQGQSRSNIQALMGAQNQNGNGEMS